MSEISDLSGTDDVKLPLKQTLHKINKANHMIGFIYFMKCLLEWKFHIISPRKIGNFRHHF